MASYRGLAVREGFLEESFLKVLAELKPTGGGKVSQALF
jgi:hypothetical protein